MDEQEAIKQPKEVVEKQGFNLWEWVKAISTLVIVGVFSFKVYQTPIALTVDFPTLLSLLLGFFSVGLAALFYFKATDTSNAFYDNTNKFTKDIAQLLAKIEAGFGERLKNIEDSNTSARDQLFQLAQKKQVLENEIEEEESEVERVKAEKDKIIDELIQKADMTDDERSKLKEELQEKEDSLALMTEKLSVYEKKMKQVRGVLEKSNQRTNSIVNLAIGAGPRSLTDRAELSGRYSTSKSHDKKIVREYCEGCTNIETFKDGLTREYLPADVMHALLSLHFIDALGEITELGERSIQTYIDLGKMNKE
jgi:IS1 family transposase